MPRCRGIMSSLSLYIGACCAVGLTFLTGHCCKTIITRICFRVHRDNKTILLFEYYYHYFKQMHFYLAAKSTVKSCSSYLLFHRDNKAMQCGCTTLVTVEMVGLGQWWVEMLILSSHCPCFHIVVHSPIKPH